MNILFFGDIVGKAGRHALATHLPRLRDELQPDLVVANVENLAHGKGVTVHTLNALAEIGVDFFTSGNHVYDKPDHQAVFEQFGDRLIRPANFAKDFPGDGYKIITVKGQSVLMINLLGQVFMEHQVDQGQVDNPFLKLNEILSEVGAKAKIKLLDMHAEATSEKRAMGFWGDGRLSAVVGTHTHVPTADAQVLPQGTGYVTDLGMTGAAQSIIGFQRDAVLKRFIQHEDIEGKAPLVIDESEASEMAYVLLEIDEETGKCQNIKTEFRIMN